MLVHSVQYEPIASDGIIFYMQLGSDSLFYSQSYKIRETNEDKQNIFEHFTKTK